jgi:hypothetical protein
MPIIWSTTSSATQAATLSQQPIYQTGTAGSALTTYMVVHPEFTTASNTASVWYGASSSQTAAATTWSLIGWEEQVDHQQYLALARNRVVAYRTRTEEERIREEVLQAERAAQMLRYQEETQAALTRSRELLLSHLTPRQRATFEKHKWFVVVGGKTMQRYRIHTNTFAGNIDVLEGDQVKHRLCVHCSSRIPLHDHHLAQKLSLESDEEYILSIANRRAA